MLEHEVLQLFLMVAGLEGSLIVLGPHIGRIPLLEMVPDLGKGEPSEIPEDTKGPLTMTSNSRRTAGHPPQLTLGAKRILERALWFPIWDKVLSWRGPMFRGKGDPLHPVIPC